MNIRTYSGAQKLATSRLLRLTKARTFIVFTLSSILGLSSNITLAGRFDPPSLKLQVENFDSRIDSGIFNVDFLLAHVVNNSRKIVREVGELTDGVTSEIQNTEIFTSSSTGASGASAGSVVIPPGTNANNIIIININEGDSIAIQR